QTRRQGTKVDFIPIRSPVLLPRSADTPLPCQTNAARKPRGLSSHCVRPGQAPSSHWGPARSHQHLPEPATLSLPNTGFLAFRHSSSISLPRPVSTRSLLSSSPNSDRLRFLGVTLRVPRGPLDPRASRLSILPCSVRSRLRRA